MKGAGCDGGRLGLLGTMAVLIVSATAVPASLSAQDSVTGTTLRVSSEFVVLDASIVRKNGGEAIADLGAEDFVLEEDGIAQRLTYFSQDRLPLSIVFLFDLTDSVRPVLKTLAAGTREVLNHLKPEDEVAVMGFSSRTIPLQEFTLDRSLAVAAVDKAVDLQDEDGTFIHEDMYEAIDQAFKSNIAGSRRVLVWLTDGSANLQNGFSQKVIGTHSPQRLHSREEATDRLVRSGVVVSALIERSVGGEAILALTYVGGAHMGDVHHYADLTGGPVLKTAKPEVAARLGELIDELRRRVTLGYKPLVGKPAGAYCKLRLQLSPAFFARHPAIRKKDVMIRTKAGYYR